MRTFQIFILLILLAIGAHAQTARKTFEKGALAATAGNYDKALRQYQKSLALTQTADGLTPNFLARIYYNIGVCFYHLNQPARAVKEYQAAIKSQPGYQKVYRAMAMAQIELNNLPAARESFETALRLDERDGESWFDLAMLLTKEKTYDRAAQSFKQAIANRSVDSSAAHNNLGVILALNNDFPSAEKEFEQSLLESNGAFITARRNLDFCRAQRAVWTQDLLSKLEFDFKN